MTWGGVEDTHGLTGADDGLAGLSPADKTSPAARALAQRIRASILLSS